MIRIGYACINTQLPSPNRTTRLANATPERVIALGRQNLSALMNILRWNQAHGIQLVRLSSEIIPLASHPVVQAQMRRSSGVLALHTMWRDSIAYSIGCLAAGWRRENGHRVIEAKRPQGWIGKLFDKGRRKQTVPALFYEGADLIIERPSGRDPPRKVVRAGNAHGHLSS